MDTANSDIWETVTLDEPNRRQSLVAEYYMIHHRRRRYDFVINEEPKVAFFQNELQKRLNTQDRANRDAMDLGCRGGALTGRLQNWGKWIGVDVDPKALEQAKQSGLDCRQMDLGVNLDFRDESFDMVLMTEVLEHLPYPIVTLAEISRILRGRKNSVFMGSVPIDYHLRRRLAVLSGRRLEGDPTHLHSFSVKELQMLLEHYFSKVHLHFVRTPHWPWNLLPPALSAIDAFWVAWGPKKHVPMADIALRH